MIGVVLIVLAMVIVLPLAVAFSGAALSAVIGWSATSDAEQRYAGSEFVEKRLW